MFRLHDHLNVQGGEIVADHMGRSRCFENTIRQDKRGREGKGKKKYKVVTEY